MSREGLNQQGNSNPRKSMPVGVSSSFNPPIPGRPRTPLPKINESIHEETDLVLPTRVFLAKRTSVKDLSQSLCLYLWFRRIKEIFLVMGKQNDSFTRFDMELARNDMIQTCEQYIESQRPKITGPNPNKSDQAKLDKWKNKRLYAETFRMSYFRKETDSSENTAKVQKLTQKELNVGEAPNFDNAIWWYSCNEAPIFDQMNNILRLENFELLMCHRYYISDLCQMIERSYLQNRSSQKQTVFRADKLSSADFELMKKSILDKDSRITINGFISTSRNQGISFEYAEEKIKKKQNDEVVIMYEITIDPAIPCSSYADIQSISFHPREEEVLFNMGSTFQIDACVDDPKNPEIKRIKLTARDYNLTLLDEMKAKVKQASQASLSILLVRYLIELGEDRICKRYLNQLIESKQLENDLNLVAVYNCLGTIHFRQSLYAEALEYYRKALNTQARLQFANNNALAEIFNNIGQAHLGLKQLEEAKQNLEEGIRIQRREPKYSRQHLASLYCNLGQVAYAEREWEEAENHFETAFDLYNQSSKISHDALEKHLLKADLCIAFGHLKSIQNIEERTEATEKFEEAVDIYERILPPSHPKVAEARINIVSEYIRNKNYQIVISYLDDHFNSVLENYKSKHTTSQMDLAILYANIGASFAHQKEFDNAMEYWKKSLEHEQKVFVDELLSSARVPIVQRLARVVESAYRQALKHYSSNTNAPKEHLAIIYTKMHDYGKAIEILRGENSVLLANIYIAQRNLKEAMKIYKRIQNQSPKTDEMQLTSLLLPILNMLLPHLSKTEKETSDEDPTAELKQIEDSLRKRVGDSEAMRLRMIINDHIAKGYLARGNGKIALECSQISFELKQRLYSSYHPSLTHNHQLVALCNFQQGDYKTAIQHYEKAIEIQMSNMPSDHPEIRANYFLMGDCYCKMDKLELANEYYDRAQATNDNENDDEEVIEQDVKALLRMHDYLTEASAQQKDFNNAASHQEARIETLKESLPMFIIEIMEDEEATNITLEQLQSVIKSRLGLTNVYTFAQVLRNFVDIRVSLARALLNAEESTNDDENADYLYEQAIELHLKLTLFENNEQEEAEHLSSYYEEQAAAYDKLYSSMQEEIQDSLRKALEETLNPDRQRQIEFRLGNLCFDEKDFDEADRYWQSALETVKSDQKMIKTIIENLIEKNKANLSSPKENDDDVEEVEDESRVQSANSQRRLSVKSLDDKEKFSEIIQAYCDLKDDKQTLKYFKQHIKKLKANLDLEVTKTELDISKLPMMKLFYDLMMKDIDKSSNTGKNSDKNKEINLLEDYRKIFTIAVRMNDSFDQVSEAMLATLHLAKQLNKFSDNLAKLFELIFERSLPDVMQWNQFADLISPAESIAMFMRIGQHHLSNQEWKKAFNIYCLLQKCIREQGILKCAVNYSLLKLLELYIEVEENYDKYISDVDIRSSAIPIFDRIILCQLIISYMNDRENSKATNQFKKELLDLQKLEWPNMTLKNTDNISKTLTEYDQHTMACWYWSDVEVLYYETLPDYIVTRLYSKDSTFHEIYESVEEMTNNLKDSVISWASSYEKISEYEEKDGYKDDACQSLKNAIIIWKKIASEKERVQKLQSKVEKLKIN